MKLLNMYEMQNFLSEINPNYEMFKNFLWKFCNF